MLRLGIRSNRQSVTIAAGATLTHEVGPAAERRVARPGRRDRVRRARAERRSIGNAVSTIDASDEMSKASPPDLANLLRSRAAGVDIQPISGRIGAGPTIQIRGPSSIGLTNNPLIYIDGVRVNNSTNLGPTGISGGLGAQGNPVESRMNDINPSRHREHRDHQGSRRCDDLRNGSGERRDPDHHEEGRVGRSAAPHGRSREVRCTSATPRIACRPTTTRTSRATSFRGTACRRWRTAARRSSRRASSATTRRRSSADCDQLRYYASLGYQNDYGIEPNNLQREVNAHLNLSTPLGTTTDVSTSLNFIDMSTHLGADVGASALLGAIGGTFASLPAARRWVSTRAFRPPCRRRCTTTPRGSTASRAARRSTTSSRGGSPNARCWGSTIRIRTTARSNTSRRHSWPRSCRPPRRGAASVKHFGARP